MKILTLILLTLLTFICSCEEPLNPIPDIYRSMVNGNDFVPLSESGVLRIRFLKYDSNEKLVKARVKIELSNKKEKYLLTDTSGIVKIPVNNSNFIPGYWNIEICYSRGSEQYYGSRSFYVNMEMNSLLDVFVSKGICEKKFIKVE
ncbi:MAG: hypothetical protein KDC42_08135 [Ignavibacteriae bacterium]|nr:hypothetical protein [Ignavibacteriota bacterium]